MTEKRSGGDTPVHFLTVISLFVFFTVLIATGALFFYKAAVAKSIASMQNDLELTKNRFQPEKIAELQTLDKRLKAAGEILGQHISVTPIFEALEALTMKSVRYTKFTYALASQDNPNISVKMSGTAVGYRSIALQSDLFAKNKSIIDPVFSKLTLDDSGNVSFDLDFSVDPAFVNYKADSAAAAPDAATN